MKKNKLKALIFTLALCIVSNPLSTIAIAEVPPEPESPPASEVPVTPSKYDSTILDGKIGEWDEESIEMFKEFENNDIDGAKPKPGEYYTISVTVPLNMEFWVLPNSTAAFGSFYSPVYTIKNNGSKNIIASIKSFEMPEKIETENTTPLYIEEVVPGDEKTQMELKMLTLEGERPFDISKEVDLTKLKSLEDKDKELFDLTANEAKRVKFDSKRWELPEYESKKDMATSNFTAGFEFSIKEK